MAADTDYVPAPDGEFFDWQKDLVDEVVANEVPWGIPNTKILEIQAKRTAYNAKYTLANSLSTKTAGTTGAHRSERKVYEKYLRSFVKEYLVANSAITVQERIDIGINTGEITGGSRPAIVTSPHTSMKSLGGGFVEFENRVESDSSRPSRHEDSDGLDIRYAIIPFRDTGGSTPEPVPGDPVPPPSTQTGGMPTPEQCPHHHFSTKAKFKLELGTSNIGKLVVVYTRWKNNANPEKSGPYITIPVAHLIG